MILNITKKYRISTDERNIMLEEFRTAKKTGNQSWNFIGAWPEFDWLYREALIRGLTTSELKDVKEIFDLINTIHQEMKESISKESIDTIRAQIDALISENESLKLKLKKLGGQV